MVEEILSQWQGDGSLTGPPPTPIRLWSEPCRGVWIGSGWGPAVPYPPIDHGDGHHNHGYLRIKDNLPTVGLIPEAVGWPEMAAFLAAVNAAQSPIETVGCEKGFFPAQGQNIATVQLGSYFDVIFTDIALNDRPENALVLSGHFLQAMEGCERWWSGIEIELRRLRGLIGAASPWGLLVRVTGCGRDEGEARKCWGASIDRITKAVANLPRNFRWHGDGLN
jgi:hypothetical protein